MALREFPEGFVWGTATASYQVEGAVNEDGRGRVDLGHVFPHARQSRTKAIPATSPAIITIAVKEDVQLLKNLGVSAYRMSIAWSRILPQGRGAINEAGIDFYSSLIDELLANGITPYVTLYHWDLPQALQDEGGWMQRGIVDDYVDYVDVVTRALGDRVKNWFTFNEPWVIAWVGHVMGAHAPGLTSELPAPALAVTHHLYLAHGKAIPVIRQNSPDAQGRDRAQPQPGRPGESQARRSAGADLLRWLVQPLVSRSAVSGQLSGGRDGGLRRAYADD